MTATHSTGDFPALLAQPPITSDVDSAKGLTPTTSAHSDFHEDSKNTCPTSAFYCHPTTRYSFDVQKTEKRPIVDVYRVDLENLDHGKPTPKRAGSEEPCTVWPSHRLSGKVDGVNRKAYGGWNPWKRLSKTQKIWTKILILCIIIGAAIGIGVGISKAVAG
ncbi:MAG: hypothetical protein M1838_003183 [Thelocarpon superellum]|nr:MAG: hypothetical protein M1838_003183 [Thelocarpon superellum]